MTLPSLAPVLITGATGLVGSRVVALAIRENLPVYALVRDINKARSILGEHKMLTLIPGCVEKPFDLPDGIGSIIHGANPTSSKSFIADPVGTISVCLEGTKQMLELARKHKIKRFLYLSSGEVYGRFDCRTTATENRMGTLDPFQPRASYPEAKRLCETLCASYAAQYGLHTMVARLGVTFGPITDPDDNRLLAQFARCVHDGRDIQLQTAGRTVRSYCYVDDAASALMLLLERGEAACAYNIAHPDMTLSVREVADKIAARYQQTRVVTLGQGDPQAQGYLPEMQLELDVSRLLALSWKPQVNFDDGFARVLSSLTEKIS